MFAPDLYASRRKVLMDDLESGLVLLPANGESPMNYTDNVYPFRQDSTFLYYIGLDRSGLFAILDIDAGKTTLFGDDADIEHLVWTGPQPTVAEMKEKTAAEDARPLSRLEGVIAEARSAGRAMHFLPPYRAETSLQLGTLLEQAPDELEASEALIRAVAAQRSVKSPEEVLEMDHAINISGLMHHAAMRATRPGILEARLAGIAEGIAVGEGGRLSYPAIVSIHGQVLHNPYHHNKLEGGRLLLADMGAETARHYAGDITRTWPVNKSFNSRQRDIYSIVLECQEEALQALRPGIAYRDIHLQAARKLTEGLQGLGLMRGDIEESVQAGAHALFFPHGLGHMIGLDVHDMENLGEDFVGYDGKVERSAQFGLRSLRLGKELQPGFTVSVEPGLYFIPELIQHWEKEGRHAAFIAYDKLAAWFDFGGVRIEDIALITPEGSRLVGKPIAKTIEAVEAMREA